MVERMQVRTLIIKNHFNTLPRDTAKSLYVQQPHNTSMPCFSVELKPAKKAWKSFTSKIQSKLHKLNRYKAIKKSKTQVHATTAKALINPSPLLEDRIRHRKNLLLPSHQGLRSRRHCQYLFKKKAAPVYIDRLFIEPNAPELVAKYPLPIAKDAKLLNEWEREGIASGSGTGNEEENACGGAADDMWESLALASPLMYGIDQRAEEFIKRFRAEMKFQEMMARRL